MAAPVAHVPVVSYPEANIDSVHIALQTPDGTAGRADARTPGSKGPPARHMQVLTLVTMH
jgi:hypothetical protein